MVIEEDTDMAIEEDIAMVRVMVIVLVMQQEVAILVGTAMFITTETQV